MASKLLDRVKLVTWALVFVVGVLLIDPIVFKFGAAMSVHHGLIFGAAMGLFVGGFLGFAFTAAAMSRSADLRLLSAAQRRKFIFGLYGAALCVVIGIFLEGVSRDLASGFAWPLAAVVTVAVFVVGVRIRSWGLSQADDWQQKDKTLNSGR